MNTYQYDMVLDAEGLDPSRWHSMRGKGLTYKDGLAHALTSHNSNEGLPVTITNFTQTGFHSGNKYLIRVQYGDHVPVEYEAYGFTKLDAVSYALMRLQVEHNVENLTDAITLYWVKIEIKQYDDEPAEWVVVP